MGELIGEVLTPAIGVAVSPLPIIATILMLLSPGAKGKSIAFMLGWVVGITAVTVIAALLSSVLAGGSQGAAPTWTGLVKIVLGALLILLAAKQWRSRPAPGEAGTLPKWMTAMDSMKPVAAFGLAAALGGANPKNLMLAASAGLVIGQASPGAALTGGIVFVVLAASTVLVPVIAYLVATEAMRGPLDSLRTWLTSNNATIMTVVLLVLGVSVIGKGIAVF